MLSSFVPGKSGSPIFLNSDGELFIIYGRLHNVSALLITVGTPKTPFSVGKGGFNLGSLLSPSIVLIKVVSSPHT